MAGGAPRLFLPLVLPAQAGIQKTRFGGFLDV